MTTLERTCIAVHMAMTQRVVTVDQLIDRLGVCQRQAYRYLTALETAMPLRRIGGMLYHMNALDGERDSQAD